MARKITVLHTKQIDTLPDGFHADGDHLYLRVSDEGRRRSWVWRAVKGGKVTNMGLGRAGAGGVSLASAREAAKELNKTFSEGVNPLSARRDKERSESARKTLRAATEAYIAEKDRTWGESSRAIWRRFADRDIEVIADVPVDTLGRSDIARAVHALYAQVGGGGRARRPGIPAARLLQMRVQKVLEYSSEHGWRPENARYQWSAIAESAKGEAAHHPALMPPDAENEHDGMLIIEAMRRLRASDAISARCLEFIALTAARVGEATGARWSEINVQSATWTIPAGRMKMGRAHVVPLSSRAMEIVAEAAKHRVGDYVFTGQHDGKPISRNTVHDMSVRVTDGRASPHGFRATVRSWMANEGVPFDIAETVLAHAKEKIVAAYQRSNMVEVRRPIMERWAQFLSGEDLSAAKNVVPMVRGKAK
jgi:integrase